MGHKMSLNKFKMLEIIQFTGRKFLYSSLGNDFFDLTPKAKARKGKIKKWNNVKLKASAQ